MSRDTWNFFIYVFCIGLILAFFMLFFGNALLGLKNLKAFYAVLSGLLLICFLLLINLLVLHSSIATSYKILIALSKFPVLGYLLFLIVSEGPMFALAAVFGLFSFLPAALISSRSSNQGQLT